MSKKKPSKPIESFSLYDPEIGTQKILDLYLQKIPAGFPSPAEDFIEKRLDLNDLMIKNQSSTFLVKVEGTSMIDAGIFNGDILVVDRSIEPENNKIVLGVLSGEFTVKRLLKKGKQVILMPDNKSFKPIVLNEESDFQVWGVVTFVIHQV